MNLQSKDNEMAADCHVELQSVISDSLASLMKHRVCTASNAKKDPYAMTATSLWSAFSKCVNTSNSIVQHGGYDR